MVRTILLDSKVDDQDLAAKVLKSFRAADTAFFQRVTKSHGKSASGFLREILYDHRNMLKYTESPRLCEEILAKLGETSNQTMLETGADA